MLEPNTDDETPTAGDPIDPEDIADPADTPAEEFYVDGDGTSLQQLLNNESDAVDGVGYLGTQIEATEDYVLTEGDDALSLADDGEEGTGEGALRTYDGTPVLDSAGDINVVDGGAGNDTIAAGDEAAYVFGGGGSDTLATGEGVAALFGGSGGDTLMGGDTESYLDGGTGNDVIEGGSADEILRGGAHGEGDQDTRDNDSIDGGAGDDDIAGGYGSDTLIGGAGNDIIDHLGRAEEEVAAEHLEFGWHIDGDADTLDGGTGNDTLIFDSADTASGGDGADTFWLYDDGTGASVAEITDFETGTDALRITLDPEVDWGDMDVTVGLAENGLDSIVSVNGEEMALLTGNTSIAAHDVYVELGQNITAG